MTSTLNLIAAKAHSAEVSATNTLEMANDIDPRDLASQGTLDGTAGTTAPASSSETTGPEQPK